MILVRQIYDASYYTLYMALQNVIIWRFAYPKKIFWIERRNVKKKQDATTLKTPCD